MNTNHSSEGCPCHDCQRDQNGLAMKVGDSFCTKHRQMDCFHSGTCGKEEYNWCQCTCNGEKKCKRPTEEKCPIELGKYID